MIPVIAPETEETRYGTLLDGRHLLRFLAMARRHWPLFFLALLLAPSLALVQLAIPWVIRDAVDNHLTQGNMEGFQGLVLLMAGLVFAQLLLGYGQSLANALLGHRVVRDMREKLFAHVLTLDAAFFSRQDTGRITDRIANDTEAVSQMVASGLLNMFADMLLLMGILVCMVWLSPPLSLSMLLILPLLFWTSSDAAKGLRLLQRQGRILQSHMAGRITEVMAGHQVIRLFRGQEKCRREFDQLNGAYLTNSLECNDLEAIQFSMVEASATLVIAMLFGYGAYLAANAPVSLGVLVAFIEYVRLFFIPIRELSNRMTTTQAAMTALERIFHLLDTQPAITSPPGEKPDLDPQGGIVFQQVSFSYGDTPVLRGISCTIRPGERVAVVGPTGAGKTTLLKLLNRTLDTSAGEVRIHGLDVRTIPLPVLRRLVGVVPQETFLFAGSIGENISLGDPAITRKRVEWAARQTGAESFITTLAKGYDTLLAERGINLSAGQKQLLGMARTLAFDPSILVMDEATSSVDPISERLIQQAMKRLLQGRTSFIIAHRLGTIREADRILVLHKGCLVEEGTHGQLLEKGGLYHKLYSLQFQEGS